jgi:hypothetical protein
MIGLVVAFLSVLLPLVHVALSRHPRTGGRVVHLLLLYALVLDVGVMGSFGITPQSACGEANNQMGKACHDL